MSVNEKVVDAVFEAVDEVNQQLSEEEKIEKSLDTPLTGEKASLESLNFVTFIVAAEEKIEQRLGVVISLAAEMEASEMEATFQTIGTLVDYVSEALKSNE
ncbi:MAG: hypothetical protein R3B95_16560 [Nitrospirales bacterium]|nr:hypothetical protein [Nitrospirales bacterium]